jgi:hypothetical protein
MPTIDMPKMEIAPEVVEGGRFATAVAHLLNMGAPRPDAASQPVTAVYPIG